MRLPDGTLLNKLIPDDDKLALIATPFDILPLVDQSTDGSRQLFFTVGIFICRPSVLNENSVVSRRFSSSNGSPELKQRTFAGFNLGWC
jgi:hypothetical protein